MDAQLAANLSAALTEWRDAGGPVEEVVLCIVDMINTAVESQAETEGGK